MKEDIKKHNFEFIDINMKPSNTELNILATTSSGCTEHEKGSNYLLHCKSNMIAEKRDKSIQCNFSEASVSDVSSENIENVSNLKDLKIEVVDVSKLENYDDSDEEVFKMDGFTDKDFSVENFDSNSIDSDDSSEDEDEDDSYLFNVPEYKCLNVDGGFKCEICGKISPSRVAYVSHRKSHEESCNLCYACGFVAQNSAKLRIHVHYYEVNGRCRGTAPLKSKRMKLQCGICNKRFPQTIKLMDHINTHTKSRPYRCSCGSGFGSHSNFLAHFRKFKCLAEGRSIPNYAPQSLLMLQSSGDKIKAKNTRKCNEKLKQKEITAITSRAIKMVKPKKSNMEIGCENRGIKRARPNPVYKCLACSKIFPNAPKLRMHSESEHMERKYICSICKRKFAKERLLRSHINHFHVEKYKCEECNMVFSKVAHKTHMQSHNISRVKCKLCDALLSSKYFRAHMQRHSVASHDDKFYCWICEERCKFKLYKEHLKSEYHLKAENNMKNKLNITMFSCRLCENTDFENIIGYTQHNGVYHCWSVRKRLEEILKSFKDFKRFNKPKKYEI